jgi:hypothetical protein
MSEEIVRELAGMVGGTIEEMQRLPDGSGFAVMAMPLPANHWLTQDGFSVPPMPLRMGASLQRGLAEAAIKAAARYAIRASTMNGKEVDFDPDAMVQNFITGLLGYYTHSGLSQDAWANPGGIEDYPPTESLGEFQPGTVAPGEQGA